MSDRLTDEQRAAVDATLRGEDPKHRLSAEQRAAVEAARRGENVRVMAVPGAGKTHTCIAMVAALEGMGRKVVQLTYSANLKEESREKMGRYGGLWAPHSFHSFAQCISGSTIDEDSRLVKLLESSPPRLHDAKDVADVIIIDETQDCTPIFARLLAWFLSWGVNKFTPANNKNN